MLVLVLGVKGVGKSHLLREASKRLPGVPFELVSYGDVMLAHARAQGITDREALSKQSFAVQRRLQEKAAKDLHKRAAGDKLLFLDTHGFLYTQPGNALLPGTPDYVADLLRPDLVLLMVADPAVVRERRRKDAESGARKRAPESAELIRENQDAERVVAAYLASKHGVLLKILDRTRPVEEAPHAIEELAAVLKKLAG